MEKLIINVIKTDSGQCFISDCHKTSGHGYDYHTSTINKLLFDGKKPTETYAPHWFAIDKYPEKIQRKITGRTTNERYELKDVDMESKKLPLAITVKDRAEYDYDVIGTLYEYTYDKLPDDLQDVDCELNVVCEVNNFKELPKFEYEGIRRLVWSDETYKITNRNIEHSLIDKIILPAPLLANSPCSLSSKEVYDITRQYIKTHIDTKHARIKSDYDFCFDVVKIIPLIEPQTITYQNIFAKTKKERNKTTYKTHEIKEVRIFQMTHEQKNYENYTPIKGFTADSEYALKELIDGFLEDLITVINKPLEQCPCCNGTGYKDVTIKNGFVILND